MHTLISFRRTRRLLSSLSAVGALTLHAQVAPQTKTEDEILTLSPFQVQTTADVGYEASRALSGMGLNTKLTDIGAAISVVTAKFYEDTGSQNLSDVLVYQTNMEVKGFGGSLSGVT